MTPAQLLAAWAEWRRIRAALPGWIAQARRAAALELLIWALRLDAGLVVTTARKWAEVER